ncbi:olfactory receptor 1020-like [Bombina bombina]|uniref:olfactory receptor 1020-like n=1 Tax=Bombina bombina TaxID=8345 RepID=UPI00235A76BF|nr:olfactory receptor 1020-like [Bombina bombina]
MDRNNSTTITEFILVGLSENPEIQPFLFAVFLLTYIITVLGNLTIILVIKLGSNLHTAMYFHLANFAFLEICYISATVPKMLSSFLAERKTISLRGCITQMYCFLLFGGTECYILAAMAYDRYNAICHPLLYTIIMNRRRCTQLIVGSWLIGAVNAAVHTILTFTLPFCDSNRIDHFFCDIPPLLKLACTDTWVNELVIFLISGSVIVGSFILILISYLQIIFTIVKIKSTSGRKKAFSTCVSHFTVVTIFFGSGIFMYFRPKSSYAMEQDRVISVMYAIAAPLLNPFIYSLRNKDVKIAIRKMIYKIISKNIY